MEDVRNPEEPTTSLSARLGEFFAERATQVDWIHRVSAYDWLLSFVGFPLAFWGTSRLGNLAAAFLSHASARNFPPVVNTAIYVYAFFLSLIVCRSLFSYARWVFPKIRNGEWITAERVTSHTVTFGPELGPSHPDSAFCQRRRESGWCAARLHEFDLRCCAFRIHYRGTARSHWSGTGTVERDPLSRDLHCTRNLPVHMRAARRIGNGRRDCSSAVAEERWSAIRTLLRRDYAY